MIILSQLITVIGNPNWNCYAALSKYCENFRDISLTPLVATVDWGRRKLPVYDDGNDHQPLQFRLSADNTME